MSQSHFQNHPLQVLVPPTETFERDAIKPDTIEPESFWAQAPDDELISVFVRSRSRAAMETLVRRHGPMVGSLLGRMLSKHEDREEAFQATFIVLMKSADRIRKRASIGSFLYGVAFRIAKRVRQRRSDEFKKSIADGHAMISSHVSDDVLSPFEQLAQRLQLESMDEELQLLPEKMRAAIVAHYYSGRSVPQIAESMQLSISAVEGRIKRGKQLLRNRLAVRGVSLTATLAAIAQLPSPVSASMVDSWCHEFVASETSFETSSAGSNVSSPSLQQLIQGELSMHLTHRTSLALWTCGICAISAIGLGLLPITKDGNSLSSRLAISHVGGTEMEAEATMPISSSPAQSEGQAPGASQVEKAKEKDLKTEANNSKAPTTSPVVWTQPSELPEWLKKERSRDLKTDLIREGLDRVVSEVKFMNAPLSDVVKILGQQFEFDFRLDKDSLEEMNITPEHPITLELKPLSLRNALYHILTPLYLDYEIDHDVLVIKNKEAIRGELRTYDLSLFLPDNSTVLQLVQVIQSSVEPDSWEVGGGNFAMDVFGSLLVVKAPDSIHEQIEELLRLLSKQQKDHIRPGLPKPVPPAPPGMGGMM